ncbi:MAG: C4-dicarboxylate ABC transporter substrate-binding protein [Hyphomicrobiaceae bacterium]|nr:MAG: C4-dicarboxylate ABC transporter substrate-binding protein [Hyphomicrobiaceae bacterium]
MKTKALSALAIVLAVAASTPTTAQTIDGPKVEWNFSTWGKKRAFTAGIEKVAEIVSQRTAGKFTIKIHYAEALSKDKENLDGIKIGAFEMADFCNFYHPGKNPAYMVLSLPFLSLADWNVSKDVREAMLKHPAFVADMAQWNAQAYMSGLLPQYEFLGKGKPPATIEDWKGLRVRAGGGIGDAMRVLGAVLSTVPATEVYTAIERGTVDAASFPFTYAHAAYQVHTVTDWFTSNLSPGTAECNSVINKDAYAKLPPQYQKLLQEAKEPAYAALVNAYVEIDKVNLPLFKSKLKEVVYTDAELKKFREVAGKPVWDKWVADNKGKFDAQNVLDTVVKEIEKAEAKHKKKS